MAAISGKSWTISLVGAVVCLLSVGILFLGSLCGLVALVLLILGKAEFEDLYYVDPGSDQYYEEGYEGYYEGEPQYGIEQTDQYYDDQQPRNP